ncbi:MULTISPECIES: DUF6011 domain-containing protein [unclassified Bradyrhizobium]|uniref:DUF6011 domain-containing protein n=1 Tax=unclassified Bradyrhizobium TaxID=2631580 RepID=UPI0033970AFD
MFIPLSEVYWAKVDQLDTLVKSGALAQSSDFGSKLVADARKYRQLSEKQLVWVQRLIDRSQAPAREQVAIGDLSGINALFERAQQHLKKPRIVLNAGADADGVPYLIALSVAQSHHRMPGTINVAEHDDTKEWNEQLWYGRILKDGQFELSPKVSTDNDARENANYIVGQLKLFADDPVGVATAHGVLTGRCCFCHGRLKDERSTAVGYGSTCADNWGLAWGSRPAQFAAPADAAVADIPKKERAVRVQASRRNIRLRGRS